jgi:hypothetical protein
MKTLHIAGFGLWLRLQLGRIGVINITATVLVMAGIAAWGWVLPQLQQQDRHIRVTLAAAQKSLATPPTPTAITPTSQNEQRLQQFYDALGESHYAEQQIKTLFAIAAKNDLTLNQAEYKYGYDKAGKFHTYAISLPVKGAYSAIRPFCEQVLLAIPFASLDTVDFKRDAVGNSTIDAKLHFTLHLDNGVDLPIGTLADTAERGETP